MNAQPFNPESAITADGETWQYKTYWIADNGVRQDCALRAELKPWGVAFDGFDYYIVLDAAVTSSLARWLAFAADQLRDVPQVLTSEESRKLLDTSEAARFLGISKERLTAKVRAGEIHAVKTYGGGYAYRIEDLESEDDRQAADAARRPLAREFWG